MINSNLGPILHRLATIHPWQTDGRMDGRTDGRTTIMTKGRP